MRFGPVGHCARFRFGIKRVRASAKLQIRSYPDHRTFGYLEQIPPLSRRITPTKHESEASEEGKADPFYRRE